MGFTLGGVTEALDREVKVGLAIGADGMVHGVTSWMPVYGGEGRGGRLDPGPDAHGRTAGSGPRWNS